MFDFSFDLFLKWRKVPENMLLILHSVQSNQHIWPSRWNLRLHLRCRHRFLLSFKHCSVEYFLNSTLHAEICTQNCTQISALNVSVIFFLQSFQHNHVLRKLCRIFSNPSLHAEISTQNCSPISPLYTIVNLAWRRMENRFWYWPTYRQCLVCCTDTNSGLC